MYKYRHFSFSKHLLNLFDECVKESSFFKILTEEYFLSEILIIGFKGVYACFIQEQSEAFTNINEAISIVNTSRALAT